MFCNPSFRRARAPLGRRLLTATLLAVIGAGGLAFAPDSAASEAYGTATNSESWGGPGSHGLATIKVWGYGKDYGCGFFGAWDCASVRGLGGRLTVTRIDARAKLPTLLKMKTSAGFDGLGLDVYVSAPPSLGFRDTGKSCVSPDLEGGPGARSVSYFQEETVCTAKTIGYVRTIKLSATGYYRLGNSTWYSVTASASRQVGA
jgi:hypothetical protein